MDHKLDTMCRRCRHLSVLCAGSYSGFYTGCILRNVPADKYIRYENAMTELFEKGASKQ